MQILDIRGQKWTVGIEWEILPGDGPIKTEAKEVATKTDNKFGVLVEYENTYAIGLAKKFNNKFPSAALTLAIANQEARENNPDNAFPDWIVIEDAGEDRYWMSVIKTGIPAPQFDELLSITEVKDRMTELLINDTFEVFSPSTEIISIFEGFKSIVAKGLNELTEDTEVENKFEKLIGIPNSVIFGSIAFVAVCAAIWGVSLLIEGKNLKEKAEYFAQQAEEEKIMRQKKFERAVEKYTRDKELAKTSALDEVVAGISGNPAKILNAFYNTLGSTPFGTHGWDLKKTECYFNLAKSQTIEKQQQEEASGEDVDKLLQKHKDVKEIIACDQLYARTGYNTTRMFLTDYPNAKIDGDYAIVHRPVKIDTTYIVKLDNSILEALPTAKRFGFDIQSQLQLIKIAGVEHQILGSNNLNYQLPGKPIDPGAEGGASAEGGQAGEVVIKYEPESVEPLGYAVGEIIIKGKGLEMLRELADNVDFTGASIRKISLDGDFYDDLNWVATFNYYIKTTDGGSISNSNSNIGQKDNKPQAAPGTNPTPQEAPKK